MDGGWMDGGWTDTNLAPPKIFAGAYPRPGTGVYFDSLSWNQMTSLIQKRLRCKEACFERGKFQARKSNLSPEELL